MRVHSCPDVCRGCSYDLGRGSDYLLHRCDASVLTCGVPTISSVLGRAPGFCSHLLFLSGLHLTSLVLQIGRPGNIIPRARIWQRSLNAKRKPRGFNDAPERSHLFFSANLWHLATGLMSREQAPSPTRTVEVSPRYFLMHPCRGSLLLAASAHCSVAPSTAGLWTLPCRLSTLFFPNMR